MTEENNMEKKEGDKLPSASIINVECIYVYVFFHEKHTLKIRG